MIFRLWAEAILISASMISSQTPHDFRHTTSIPHLRLCVSLEATAVRSMAVTATAAALFTWVADRTTLWVPSIEATRAEDRGGARSAPWVFPAPVTAHTWLALLLHRRIGTWCFAACGGSGAAHACILVRQQRGHRRDRGFAWDEGIVAVPLHHATLRRGKFRARATSARAPCHPHFRPISIGVEPRGRRVHRPMPMTQGSNSEEQHQRAGHRNAQRSCRQVWDNANLCDHLSQTIILVPQNCSKLPLMLQLLLRFI